MDTKVPAQTKFNKKKEVTNILQKDNIPLKMDLKDNKTI